MVIDVYTLYDKTKEFPSIFEVLSSQKGSLAHNTERALQADAAVFTGWCRAHELVPLPASPETVIQFIEDVGMTRKAATIRRYIASIAFFHKMIDIDDPTKTESVRRRVYALLRSKGSRQRQVAPLGEKEIEQISKVIGDRLIDKRDFALLLVSRDLLARRSEVVGLTVSDLNFQNDNSCTVLLKRSKTDQEGRGDLRWLSPKTCVAVKHWLQEAQIASGPLFRAVFKGDKVLTGITPSLDPGEVARIFKKLARRANLEANQISGHSCRVGMAQDLVAAGAELPAVMQAGRWKSSTMPSRYAEHLLAERSAVAKYYKNS